MDHASTLAWALGHFMNTNVEVASSIRPVLPLLSIFTLLICGFPYVCYVGILDAEAGTFIYLVYISVDRLLTDIVTMERLSLGTRSGNLRSETE